MFPIEVFINNVLLLLGSLAMFHWFAPGIARREFEKIESARAADQRAKIEADIAASKGRS